MSQADIEIDNDEEAGAKSTHLHHDDWLIPGDDTLRLLTDEVFAWVEARRPSTGRKRRDAAERRREMTANLVANFALLTAYRPPGSRLIISARAVPQSRYVREDFPKAAFMDVVAGMEEARLVERERGYYIAKAKDKRVYRGRPEDAERNARIMELLREDWSYGRIQEHLAHPMMKNG